MDGNAFSNGLKWADGFLAHPATQMAIGALISALVSILLEWKKRAKVRVWIDPDVPEHVTQRDAERTAVARYEAVRLIVANQKRLPKFWPRQSLTRASARISFHDAHTGADLFGRAMKGRWASLPQPEIVLFINNKKTTLSDLSLISSAPELDIPWGEQEELDIAARFENDAVYGWSNENYYDPNGLYQGREVAYRRRKMPRESVVARIWGAVSSCLSHDQYSGHSASTRPYDTRRKGSPPLRSTGGS